MEGFFVGVKELQLQDVSWNDTTFNGYMNWIGIKPFQLKNGWMNKIETRQVQLKEDEWIKLRVNKSNKHNGWTNSIEVKQF